MAKNGVVAVMMVLLLGAYLLPGALNAWFDVDTSGWDPGAAGLWVVVPILALLVLVMAQAREAEGNAA